MMKTNCPICKIKMKDDGPLRFCNPCNFKTFKINNDIVEYTTYPNWILFIRFSSHLKKKIWRLSSKNNSISNDTYSGEESIPYFSTEEQILNYLIMR